ncbi:MAG: DUF6328 family protein [Actinomycetota bacterium]
MGAERVQRDGGKPEESREERLDRELIELLNELRVALPGVQVLFAFLLTLPFTQRFTALTGLQRDVYFGTFCAAIVATTLLMTPSAYHRLRFRRRDKERMLRISNRAAIAGLASLAAAICGAAFLIGDLLFETGGAAATLIATAALLLGLWFVLPLSREAAEE